MTNTIDRVALSVIFVLTIIIVLLTWGVNSCGDNCWFSTGAKVRDFSWNNRVIGAEDQAFILSFDRPMNKESVEQNLLIQPPLSGKFSWAGRRLAYTLLTPAPYGNNYKVILSGATENFSEDKVMQPFLGEFKTRDRAFVYIGIDQEQRGKLILYNWTKDNKTILTPDNLIVTEFKTVTGGDRLVFLAVDKTQEIDILNQKLYSLDLETKEIKLILDTKDYQNLRFDITPNGKTIVIQRINKNNHDDFGLWLINGQGNLMAIDNSQGGDFLLTPDSENVILAQGEGLTILPLIPDAKPLDFLPNYGRVITFSQNGNLAAMENFNKDNPELTFINSLYLVNSQGLEEKLLDTEGSIKNCQFNPNSTMIYCLVTEVLEDQENNEYLEQPYLAEINLQTKKIVPLLMLPNYQDVEIAMAKDGLGILFDQLILSETNIKEIVLRSNSGGAIKTGKLWFVIPPSLTPSESTTPELEQLPFSGIRPQWLP
jgi:hypothetical protein